MSAIGQRRINSNLSSLFDSKKFPFLKLFKSPISSKTKKGLSKKKKTGNWIQKTLSNTGRPFYYLFLVFFIFLSIAFQLCNLSFQKIAKIHFSFPVVKLPVLEVPKILLPTLPKLSLKFRMWPVISLISTTYLLLTFYFLIIKDLPSPKSLSQFQPKLTSQILDRNGTLLYALYQDENRILVNLEDIPLHIQQATIAIEDKHFYQHQGLSFSGILRAIRRNLTTNRLEGGSTITQQLIKNTLLTKEKTLTRKLKEVILAIHTELIYSKDTILEMYLNQVAYGGTAYGIQAASHQYFDKDVTQLTLAQAALLAALPQAPTRYSPYGTNPTIAQQRQHSVLKRMLEDNYISNEQYQQAIQEKITFAPPTTPILAPHFVMYVKDLLVQHFGETTVNQGGLQVHTTLDMSLQDQAQKIVATEVNKLQNLNVGNGSALILMPKTGEILAMVGSKNYFDFKNDGQVNLTLSLRQPGSSVKPINYALAFENGASPSQIISDTPITFYLPGSDPWSPKNYDNRFHGNVTLRTALANSYNIPAVKLLANNGISQMVQLATNLGISTWNDSSRQGLSLTLGSLEVTMLDLARVYSTFANLGETVNLNPILSITGSNGQPIPFDLCSSSTPNHSVAKASASGSCPTKKTLSSQTSYMINDILSDPLARAQAFGLNSILNIPGHQVAVKTGTSNDLRDNWTFGYTKDFVVATWVGNNDNTPMHQIASGITGASPIWAKIMTVLLKDQVSHRFDLPESLVKVNICTLTNTLPCNACPHIRSEIFQAGKAPTTACTKEQIEKVLEEKLKKELEENTTLTQQTISPNPQILEGASTTRKKKTR